MFNYSVEELLEKIDKTLITLSQERAQKDDQTFVLMASFLRSIRDYIAENKTVTVENIGREIVNSLDINRPKWLDELKKDDSKLIAELHKIVSAVDKKEVVKEIDIKQSSWLKAALKKNKPVEIDYTSLLKKILTEVAKETKFPAKMEVFGKVDVPNPITISQPKWYSFIDYSSMFNAIIDILKKPFNVSVDNPIIVKNEVDVKVKNPVNVGNTVEVIVRDGQGRIIDFDKQFGRMSVGGGATGAGASAGQDVLPNYDDAEIDQTDPLNIIITYKNNGQQVYQERVVTNGTIISIIKS